MFGYIRPAKGDLKVKEFELYRSIYCGLCKQLGRAYGPFARMTLSYDFAFLSLLHMEVNGQTAQIAKQCCFVNPLKKKPCCLKNPSLEFSAAAAMVMLYYKVIDNIQDSKGFKKVGYFLMKPFAKSAYKKACKSYPELGNIVSDCMSQQAQLEQLDVSSIDRAAQPTAQALSQICMLLTQKPEQKRVLERFGYCLGRWVYLMDAFDDMEEDLKNHNYNPFLLRFGIIEADEQKIKQAKEYALGALNLTLGELANAYVLLDVKTFEPIFYNIVYLGLPLAQRQILIKKENQTA